MNHGLARGISFQLRRTALRACAAAFFFFAAPLSAQQEDDLLIRRSLVTGHASFVTARNGEAIFTSNVAGQTTAMDFLQTYGALFGVNDALGELQFDSAEIDALGHTRTTYLQVHQGIEVFSGVLRVHQNVQGQVIAANGDFYPVALKFPPTPTLKPDEALQIALAELGTTAAAVERRTLVLVDPGWYGDPPRGMRLAYYLILNNQLAPLVQVGVAQPLREAFFIDAHSGAVLDRWSLVYDAKNRRIYDAQAGSDCCFVHEDPGCDDTDCEALVCAAWAACCEGGWANICGARAAQLCGTMCLPGTLVRAEGDPATGEVGVDALYDYLGDTYDFFLRAYGRDGFNDEGEAIVATINSLAIGCPNAAWFGGIRQMLFCSDTTSDDIIAHEFMHAVTQETANLIYQNQSGQLNESYSDVFGELIDLFNGDVSGLGPPTGTPWPAHPSGAGLDEPNLERSTCSDPLVGYSDGIRWLIGEDAIGFGNAIRDMWDPTCLGDPDRANSPLQTCSIIDGGGVHSGSGIPNHAFALLTDGGSFNGVEVEGIGATKSAAVWFRALTTYLSIASDFDETYAALNQSALDLIGVSVNDPRTGLPIPSAFTTHDATQVDRALRAVEMDTPGRCGASVDVLDAAPAPTCAESVTLFADDMEGDLSGWSVSHEGEMGPPTPYDWIATEGALPFGRTGVAWFCADPKIGDCNLQNESSLHSLVSPPIDLPDDATYPYLAFTHYMETEPGWDGGRVSLRVNGGAWQGVSRRYFEFNPYNSSLRLGSWRNFNPLAGKSAWTGIGGRWGTSVVDLRTLVQPGDQMEIRFEFGKDGCAGARGWYVDDLIVYHCPDCNRNNNPDHRDFRFSATTDSVGQIGITRPQSFVIEYPPLASGDVVISVRAQADLSSDSEWLELRLNGRMLGRLFETGGRDCAGASDLATLIVPARSFNAMVGSKDAYFLVSASDRVSPTLCSNASFVSLELSYPVDHQDVNDNGILDECENCSISQPVVVEPNPIVKNRYLSIEPQNAGRHTALQVTLANLPPLLSDWNGTKMWVGSPRWVRQGPGDSNDPSPLFAAAPLRCYPVFYDWGSIGTVHVFDEWIIPEAEYEVRAVDLACDMTTASFYSAPLTVSTGLWGDVAGTCGDKICRIPDGVVDINDVSAVLDTFRGMIDAPHPTQADVAGNEPNVIVDIIDVLFVSDAFRGATYPFSPTPRCTP